MDKTFNQRPKADLGRPILRLGISNNEAIAAECSSCHNTTSNVPSQKQTFANNRLGNSILPGSIPALATIFQ